MHRGHVVFEAALLSESLGAYGAGIGLLTSMGQFMALQMSSQFELLMADVTDLPP